MFGKEERKVGKGGGKSGEKEYGDEGNLLFVNWAENYFALVNVCGMRCILMRGNIHIL